MMQILKGIDTHLQVYMQQLHESDPNSLIISPVHTACGQVYRPANGQLRSLLAQFRSHIGDKDFIAIIERHKVAASFLLDRLYSELSAEEKAAYARLQASILSSTSHNWYVIRPLIIQWTSLFDELISFRETHLIIPNVLKVRGSCVSVLFRLLIDFKPETLKITLGYESNDYDPSFDKNGIRWDGVNNPTLIHDLSILSDQPSQWIGADDIDQYRVAETDTLYIDPLDSNRDQLLCTSLEQHNVPSEAVDEYIRTLEWTFGVYDYSASLQFGLKLLEQTWPLSRSHKFMIHMITAVSAHNRQFDSGKGSSGFNEFLETHLRKAVEYAEDPIARNTATYRLAVTVARREKQPDNAISLINNSLTELAELPLSRRRLYVEAWLFNIRAYAHSLKKNKQQAAWDVEKAYQVAEEEWGSASDATIDEIYTLNVFATNRATLAQYEHDNDNIMSWLEKGTEVLERHRDVGKRFFRYHKMRPLKEQFDLKNAIIAAEEGLADAIYEQSAQYQDLYLVNLAELHYRLGEPRLTADYATRALDLYSRIGEHDRRIPLMMLLAGAERRLGNYAGADKLYQQGAELLMPSTATLVDVLSIRAILAAHQNAAVSCESLMHAAIEAAVASGERNAMVLAARRAGEAFMLLGQPEQACAAYQQALDVASATPSTNTPKPPSSDMARILVNLFALEQDPSYIEQAIHETPHALLEDADFWWELPQILELLSSNLFSKLHSSHPREVASLLKAASQRVDCYARLQFLHTPSQPQPHVTPAFG